jgi:drug/metabolite transporter (DMT)-like permease
MEETGEGKRVLVSYLTLRRVVGILGVSLPPILVVGCVVLGSGAELQDSISDYYGTDMRNVFVGVLFAIGLFLFSYRGYERKDDIAGDLACILALGVALFPTTSESKAIRAVHFLSATGLFLVLSYFSLVLFTKTKRGVSPTPEKQIRNWIYVACGGIMLACIASIALYYALLQSTPVAAIKPVFWLESMALWAFGLSWFVKGETVWVDVEGG